MLRLRNLALLWLGRKLWAAARPDRAAAATQESPEVALPAKCRLGGGYAVFFDLGALSSSALDQIVEVGAAETRRETGRGLQALPQGQLAGDAHGERLKLEYAAQGRVAAQSAVQFEATQPLRKQGYNLLRPRPRNAKVDRDAPQRPAVVVDFGGQALEKVAGSVACIAARRPSRERDTGRRCGQVVGQIDLEQAIGHASYEDVLSEPASNHPQGR